MGTGQRGFGGRMVHCGLGAVIVVGFGMSRANATEPPDSTEPDTVALDDERQEIFGDVTSLGVMLGLPLDPACLSALLAEFPADELAFLAVAVESRIEIEQLGVEPEPLSGYPAPFPGAEVADFAYESIQCIRGDADAELLKTAVARVADDSGDIGVDMACVEAFLSTLRDEMLVAVAERRQLSEEDMEELSRETVLAALKSVAMMNRLCGPDGREQVGDIMGLPINTPPLDGIIPGTSEG